MCVQRIVAGKAPEAEARSQDEVLLFVNNSSSAIGKSKPAVFAPAVRQPFPSQGITVSGATLGHIINDHLTREEKRHGSVYKKRVELLQSHKKWSLKTLRKHRCARVNNFERNFCKE